MTGMTLYEVRTLDGTTHYTDEDPDKQAQGTILRVPGLPIMADSVAGTPREQAREQFQGGQSVPWRLNLAAVAWVREWHVGEYGPE